MSDRMNGLDKLARREQSWTVRQEDLLRYAAVALDFNTIHFDHAAARAAGFDRPIAHGMWNLGLVITRVADAVGVEHIRSAQTRFSAPAYVGVELRLAFVPLASGSLRATVTDDSNSTILTTQIELGDQPAGDIAEAPPEGELVADRHFVVEQGPATRFAATLGAGSAVFHRRDAAEASGYRSIPTLPTYGFVLPGWGFAPELPGNEKATAPDPIRDCQDWARTRAAPVHAGQDFTFSRPLFVGERLHSRTYVEGRAVKRSHGRVLEFTDVRNLVTDAGGNHVLTSAMTIVAVRDPGPFDEPNAHTGGTHG